MTQKLWQTKPMTDSLVEAFTSGNDVVFDQHLVTYDIIGSLAHAQMLHKQKLLSSSDWNQLQSQLLILLEKHYKGELILSPEDEDVHTRIETELTKLLPGSGPKLHLGRSRNDQILLDTRLYAKDQLLQVASLLLDTAASFVAQAKNLQSQPLPGMTHFQPAMLSSFGMWLGSFAEALVDVLSIVSTAYDLNDQSPLGSGAGYGVTVPLDREYVAELLGFSRVQKNALYCQNSRGKIEALTVHALSQILGPLNTFASDCLIFSSEPFSFISFDPSLGTGSSIMPQKQNWDGLELTRAHYHELLSLQLQVQSLASNLPSGYNRDFQLLKPPLIRSFELTKLVLQVVPLYVSTMKLASVKIEAHLPKELFAAHWAFELTSEKQMAFREAYHFVKTNLRSIPNYKPEEVLKQATVTGSTGKLGLNELERTVTELRRRWKVKANNFDKAVRKIVRTHCKTPLSATFRSV